MLRWILYGNFLDFELSVSLIKTVLLNETYIRQPFKYYSTTLVNIQLKFEKLTQFFSKWDVS